MSDLRRAVQYWSRELYWLASGRGDRRARHWLCRWRGHRFDRCPGGNGSEVVYCLRCEQEWPS